MSLRVRVWLSCLLAIVVCTQFGAVKQPIRKPKFDPSVPPIGLFAAREQGLVETEVVARNANSAKLFVTNTSDAPVSVELPAGIVAVQVLKQVPGGISGGSGNGLGGGEQGGAQPLGGGLNSNSGRSGNSAAGPGVGNNQNLFGNQGNGLFTVPPDKTIELPLRTVCLAHGRPDPTARMKYQVLPVEEFTSDPAVQQLIGRIHDREVDIQAAQAAAWHLANGMSWTELERKQIVRIGGLPAEPFFTKRQLQQARLLAGDAGRAPRETAAK